MKHINKYFKSIITLLVVVGICSNAVSQVNGFTITTPAGNNSLGASFPVNVSFNWTPTTTSATTVINYSASVLLPAGSGINYSLFQTLDQVNNNYIAFNDQTTKFFPSLGFVNETSSQIGNSSEITNFVLLKVNSSATPITDTFDFIFLQE